METNKLKFLDLYSMVMADGIAHPKELETLYRIGTDKYGLTSEEMNEAVKASGVYNIIPELPEERISLLYELAIIAWADGEIEDTEKQMLRRYANRYGVRDDRIDELIEYLLDKAKGNIPESDVINELKS